MANAPPEMAQWNAFYNRFIDLIFQHNAREDDAGKFARRLIRQIDSLWVFLEVHGIEIIMCNGLSSTMLSKSISCPNGMINTDSSEFLKKSKYCRDSLNHK